MLIILQGSDRFWKWLRTISAKSTGACAGFTRQGQRQQSPQEIKNLRPPASTRRNPPRSKAANTSRNQEFAASAVDSKKPASVKGSKHLKKSRICCLRHRREGSRLGQRQQTSQEIKNLPPPPSTRRVASRSKAAIILRNQEFAASGVDAKKSASDKGSNHPMKSGICCLRHRREEARVGQRQQSTNINITHRCTSFLYARGPIP